MALRIGDDGRIAAAFPVVELHHFVFRAPRKTLAELVANNGINAGIVIPNALETTPLEDWANARTPVDCDQRQDHRYWSRYGPWRVGRPKRPIGLRDDLKSLW